jgi:hypothetical protein
MGKESDLGFGLLMQKKKPAVATGVYINHLL